VSAGADGLDVTIRSVTIDDLDALVEVYLAGAAHHAAIDPAAFRVPDRDAVAVRLRRRVDHCGPEHEYVVAMADGRIVGSATMDLDDLPDPGAMARRVRAAELGIAVFDAWRGQGIGRLLIAHLERWAADQGVERVILNVSTANDGAIRLYHGLGYEDAGIEMRKELVAR
jgi:GNAT superfamily N-acetyltransferase